MCDLEGRLQRSKDNVEEIQSILRSWSVPVFERREGRRDALLGLDDRAERLHRFYALIRSSGEKIHFLLKVLSSRYLTVSASFHHRPNTSFWRSQHFLTLL